jgi:multiple sugar transport system substrate-binding protein
MTRRGALKGLAATSALTALPMRAHAQETTLRWWSPQGAPAQVEAYQFQIAAFEAANPGIKVVFETTSDEGYAPQLAAAFASGEVPDIVTHLPSFAVQTYYRERPHRALRRRDRGDRRGEVLSRAPTTSSVPRTATYCGTGIGNSAANMLWLRRDLMAEGRASTRSPETWDELRAACRRCRAAASTARPCPTGATR